MTIRKGGPYGEPGSLGAGGVVVASDAEARAVLEEARRHHQPFPVLGLRGGDLCRTLGGPGDLAVQFPVDLGEVIADGRLHLFVAHLVARTRRWSEVFVAMNAQWLGSWNAGPRAHPNDGLIDAYTARLGIADRFKVRARLHHGAHLPHPGIREERSPGVQVELRRPLALRLDGAPAGRARSLSVRVQPDALTVVI